MTKAKWDTDIVRALDESDWWEERIEPRVIRPSMDGCWDWDGHKVRGYGRVAIPAQFGLRPNGANKIASVHRVSYIRANGLIAADLVVDHLCKNHGCSNLDHLEVKTQRENVLAEHSPSTLPSLNLQKEFHSKCGRPYSDDNLVRSDLENRGTRSCLWCNREKSRNHAAVIRDAFLGMGMQQRGYIAVFGQSKGNATWVMGMLADGVSPERVIQDFLAPSLAKAVL